jgi:hypothetical protein
MSVTGFAFRHTVRTIFGAFAQVFFQTAARLIRGTSSLNIVEQNISGSNSANT